MRKPIWIRVDIQVRKNNEEWHTTPRSFLLTCGSSKQYGKPGLLLDSTSMHKIHVWAVGFKLGVKTSHDLEKSLSAALSTRILQSLISMYTNGFRTLDVLIVEGRVDCHTYTSALTRYPSVCTPLFTKQLSSPSVTTFHSSNRRWSWKP